MHERPLTRVTRRQALAYAGAATGAALLGGAELAGLGGRAPARQAAAAALRPGAIRRFASRPDLRPPAVAVAVTDPVTGIAPVTGGGAARDYLFLGPGYKNGAQGGPLMVDQSGEPVWFRPLPSSLWGANFGAAELGDRQVLAWWEGTIEVPLGYGRGEAVIVDPSYRELGRVRAANGRVMDVHELQLTPQGTALFTCHPQTLHADLSGIGGPRAGTVLESVIQERDLGSGRLLMEWRSLEHVGVSESYRPLHEPYDYLHVNSIDITPDGHLLISGRHTWTVYKLDRRTGEVIWRLGGKRSDFALDAAARFAWQHDARQVDAGTISLFENGSDGPTRTHAESRGLVLDLDLAARAVHVRHDYRHPRPLRSAAMGSVRMLPGGRALVGWGDQPYASEFSAEGTLTVDSALPRGQQSYRWFRLPWTGAPAERPVIAARRARRSGAVTLYASWNGATKVASWQISAAPRTGAPKPIAVFPRRGFETEIALGGVEGSVVATALDAWGRRLASSRVIRV